MSSLASHPQATYHREMIKLAFSTVACPEWTLSQVADRTIALGYSGVELRTFGDGSRAFACDPAMTSVEKVRSLFRERGIEPVSLATGVRFDEPVWPPVIGYLSARHEKSAREGKQAVSLAVAIEAPLVRVFGFEYFAREGKASAVKRIVSRLRQVLDHADKSGVRVAIENGGSFPSAKALLELIEEADHPLLGASYNLATGVSAGDSPSEAMTTLGTRLWLARVRDFDRVGAGAIPVLPGDGQMGCEAFVRSLVATGGGFRGPLVFEWDRAWVKGLEGPETVLKRASERLWSWIAPNYGAARGGPARAMRA